MSTHKPPTSVTLTWDGDLRFSVETGHAQVLLDGSGKAGPSPVQALAFALAGCMGMDIVHILTRGRHPLKSLRAELIAIRADDDPRRVLSVELRFVAGVDVPVEALERAAVLSRDKYCSVWQSMRQDIQLKIVCTTTGVEARD